MKRITKLVAMLLCLVAYATFTSCSKGNEDLILGKWKCTRVQAYWGESTTYGEEGVGDIYEFKSDGELVITKASDNSIQITTYTVYENTVTIYGLSFVVEELTKSKLILSIDGLVTEEYEKV